MKKKGQIFTVNEQGIPSILPLGRKGQILSVNGSIDWKYGELRMEIRSMARYSPIYKVLKEELSKLGYWKNKPRGKLIIQ
jgi:hypothetical protein